MKKLWAILIWGVLVFGIGTYLDKVREMLMTEGDPVQTYIIRFGIGLVLAVLVVLVGRWLRRWLGRDFLGPGDWFMIGAVAWGIDGGYDWLMGLRGTLDFQIHDTMFVISKYRAIGVVVVLNALIAFIYYLGRGMNRVLGFVHFVLTYAALYVLLWMKSFNPAYSVKGYLGWHEFQRYEMVSAAYDVMGMLLVVAQVMFVVNLFLMAFSRGRRRRVDGRYR